jgi:hypothetical protein
VYEYWGGAQDQRSIDVYEFYRSFSSQIAWLNPVICQILSHRPASTTAETTFSLGGYTLSERRTALLPARAENLILSASAFKMNEGRDKLIVPKLPAVGKITDEEEAEYFNDDDPDLFAPLNNDNLLKMDFEDNEEEAEDDAYEEGNAEVEVDAQ